MQREVTCIDEIVEKLKTEIEYGVCTIEEALCRIYSIGYDDGKLDAKGARRVYQYDYYGNIECTFRSVRQAADFHDVVEGSIQTSIREGSTCRGKRFSFEKRK